MIQRIQSVYLFLVFISSALLFIFPFCEYQGETGHYLFDVFGLVNLSDTLKQYVAHSWEIVAINTATSLIAIVTIFLFRKRKLQLKLCSLNLLLIAIVLVLILFYSDNYLEQIGQNSNKHYLLGTFLPVLSLLFTFLASRGIRKDEELVKSADRIR